MDEQPIEWPPLHRFAADGDIERLSQALNSGSAPNVRREDGATALHIAAGRGQIDALRALLDHGADPNARTRQGITPLEFAVRHAPTMIEALIKGGADPNGRGSEGQTLLRAVAEMDKIEAIEPLLRGGGDPRLAANDALTPLGFAARAGKDRVAAAFVVHAPNSVHDRDPNGMTALHHAARAGHCSVMNILLDANADLESRTANGETPLHLAASSDAIEAAEMLLAAGAYPNARDQRCYTPLHLAARDAKSEMLKLVLKALAGRADDLSTPGETPFHLAVRHNNVPEVAGTLLDAGADPNAEFSVELDVDERIPLTVAAEIGRRAMVEAMIANGADPNDSRGDRSPLEAAIRSGDAGTMKALLLAGADPDGRSGDPPPLHLAAREDPEIVAALLRHGADACAVSDEMTALHCVVEDMPAGASDIIRLLLTHGVSQREPDGGSCEPPLQQLLSHEDPDPLCIDLLLSNAVASMDGWDGGLDGRDDSWTPLHAAASNPKVPPGIVHALISFGCDVEARDSWTPLDLAAGAGSLTAIAELLGRDVSPNGVGDDLQPLACAIKGGEVEAVVALLEAGAAVDPHDHVDLALEEGVDDIARRLIYAAIDAGEFVAPQGEVIERVEGSTRFHWAAAYATNETVLARCMSGPKTRGRHYKPLARRPRAPTLKLRPLPVPPRANLDCLDEAGWTPLHWAACCNLSDKVLRWLLDQGASPSTTTPDGKAALAIAQASGNRTAKSVLRPSRAKSAERPRSGDASSASTRRTSLTKRKRPAPKRP